MHAQRWCLIALGVIAALATLATLATTSVQTSPVSPPPPHRPRLAESAPFPAGWEPVSQREEIRPAFSK
jgi:hypothetical protein